LKKAAGYLKKEGIISLGGGLPSSEYFPFSEVALRVPMPPDFSEKSMQTVTIGKHDAHEGVSEYDLSIALNYNQATGSAQMMRFLTEHVELIFNPPYADWQVCQTIGSTGALEQAIRLLCDRGRGDAVVTEEYTYASALQAIQPQGIRVFGVKMDEEGMIPSELDHLLSSWDAEARDCRRPHVLYTVPSGQNPTGATQSVERRRHLYAVCQRYNVFVLEDEPYYFLQMEPYLGKEFAQDAPTDHTTKSLESFLGSLVPSYLSIDTDGRVMRMDSFSKILTPGARMGWITASRQVIQGFLRHAEVSNQGPGGVSQIVLWKLLDETWGHEGYVAWLRHLRTSYTARRNTLLKACDELLPCDIVTWTPPAAGMFVSLPLCQCSFGTDSCSSG
jgi:aromatic amino acid aminotransferase I